MSNMCVLPGTSDKELQGSWDKSFFQGVILYYVVCPMSVCLRFFFFQIIKLVHANWKIIRKCIKNYKR